MGKCVIVIFVTGLKRRELHIRFVFDMNLNRDTIYMMTHKSNEFRRSRNCQTGIPGENVSFCPRISGMLEREVNSPLL